MEETVGHEEETAVRWLQEITQKMKSKLLNCPKGFSLQTRDSKARKMEMAEVFSVVSLPASSYIPPWVLFISVLLAN